MFGLLRQKKLDFMEIYSEEMIVSAKAIVAQVETHTHNDFVKLQINVLTVYLCSQCVADSVVNIEEIDTEVVTK